jgi:hypothetical protein
LVCEAIDEVVGEHDWRADFDVRLATLNIDSLSAVRLAGVLKQLFGVTTTLADVLRRAPTAHALVCFVWSSLVQSKRYSAAARDYGDIDWHALVNCANVDDDDDDDDDASMQARHGASTISQHIDNTFEQRDDDNVIATTTTTTDFLNVAPASAAQQQLLAIHQRDDTMCAYNIGNALIVRGALQRQRLRCAIDAVVASHDVLRAVLLDDGSGGGGVEQRLCDATLVATHEACGGANGDLYSLVPAVPRSRRLRLALAGRAPMLAHFGGLSDADALLDAATRIVAVAADHNSIYSSRYIYTRRTLFASLLGALHIDDDDDDTANDDIERLRRALESKQQRVPTSLALTFVVQMCHYVAWLDAHSLRQIEARTAFAATCGHSVGVAAASVIALARTDDELLALATTATTFLVLLGECAAAQLEQQHSDSCMLAVAGLDQHSIVELIK